MKKTVLVIGMLFPVFLFSQSISTTFERSGGRETPTYGEIIDWWQKLDHRSAKIKMLTMGMTDAGFPLHLVVISNTGEADFEVIRKKNKRVILINNGIHPGEPDGIDASMLLARDIVTGAFLLPNNIVLAVIPVYNIGGCLNRSTDYRVDQNGPEAFGSRGNSQNLDLNRDFIKCDSKDARAFTAIFHLTDPDVFVDNHVSNGADYQHVMTLLTTQYKKLDHLMGDFLHTQFEPALYSSMKEKGYDLVPYVNSFRDTPENGWPEFWDSPRYGSGYAALWHTFSFVPETHMLKPYDQRVKATYTLLQSFIAFTTANSGVIKKIRTQARDLVKSVSTFPLSWSLDRTIFKNILYKGYEAGYKASGVSGLPRLYYNRNKPFEKLVPVFGEYKPVAFVQKPKAYIIPQGWWKVTELLQLNKVKMRRLQKDTVMEVEVYRIEDYKTSSRQYEMHHLNSEVKVSTSRQSIGFRKGDWYIPMDQTANRFLMEVLEPQAEDSYFAWNYFDAILGQKEGYSAYVFEDLATARLQSDPVLRGILDQKKITDTAFARSADAQLNFIYQHSPYAEPGYLRYPVFRLLK